MREETSMHQWKLICELTDHDALGSEGLCTAKPIEKARAILRCTEDGKYAVIHERKTDLYMLPGGGIEDGEGAEAAIRREIFEETGCICAAMEPLGIIAENRFHSAAARISYFFAADTQTAKGTPHFTEHERQLDTEIIWCSFDEMLRLIREPVYDSPDKRFLQARDLAALHAYSSISNKQPD